MARLMVQRFVSEHDARLAQHDFPLCLRCGAEMKVQHQGREWWLRCTKHPTAHIGAMGQPEKWGRLDANEYAR